MSESFHDELIKDVAERPIPDSALPDLLDVLLMFCYHIYGAELARWKAISIIRRQQAKGLAVYGQPLTVETSIDWIEYLLEEIADSAAYQRGFFRKYGIGEQDEDL